MPAAGSPALRAQDRARPLQCGGDWPCPPSEFGDSRHTPEWQIAGPVTDEMVERAARRLAEVNFGYWPESTVARKDFRDDARSALNAVFNPKEGDRDA